MADAVYAFDAGVAVGGLTGGGFWLVFRRRRR